MAKFDELNVLRSEPFDVYFASMDITDEQEQERISLAEQLEVVINFEFNLIKNMADFGVANNEFLMDTLVNRLFAVISGFVALDDYLNDYIKDFANLTVLSTIAHMDDEYFLSTDRARFIAENESNTILNHVDYIRAKEQKFKKKKWVTVLDNKERSTHRKASGTVVGIDDPFKVGTSSMMYPKDVSLGADAREIVNCRCTVKYLK